MEYTIHDRKIETYKHTFQFMKNYADKCNKIWKQDQLSTNIEMGYFLKRRKFWKRSIIDYFIFKLILLNI